MPPKSAAERAKAYRIRKRANNEQFRETERVRHYSYRSKLIGNYKTIYNKQGSQRKRLYRERIKSAARITEALASDSDDGEDVKPVPASLIPKITSPYGTRQAEGRNCKRINKKSRRRYIQAVASLLENEEVSLGSQSSSNGQTFTIGQTPANQFTSSCQSPISGVIFPNGPTPLSGAYPPPPSPGGQTLHVDDIYVKEEPEERVISAAQLLHLSGYEAGGGGSTLLKDEHCQDLNPSLLEMKMEATEEFFDDPAFLISPAKL